MSASKQKYYRIKRTLPAIIRHLGDQIEEKVSQGKSQLWYNGLQCALESEIKCQVMSTGMNAEQAYIVASYFGIPGHWENLEPLHVAIKREKQRALV